MAKKLAEGTEVTINVPFTYTIGEEGPKTGNLLETVEDCEAEAEAELVDGLDGDILMNVEEDLTQDVEKLKSIHEKIRNVLIDNGSEEFGDVIIDEICEAVGIPPTTVYYEEE